MNYYIGIDNSSLDHKVQVIDESGNKKSAFTIPNNLKGFELLHQRLKEFKKDSEVRIGFELPHGPLVDYLHHMEYTLYSLNPLQVKRYKESIRVSGDKTDAIDATAIADYLRHNSSHSRELLYNSSEIEKLKHLSLIHQRLVKDRSSHINKLHFAVRQYFPLHEELFSLFGRTVQLKMIKKYPTFKDLKAVSEEELTEFLKSCNYRHHALIGKMLGKIRNHEQLIAPEVEYAYQFEALAICEILQSLEEKLCEIKKEMNRITDSHKLGGIFRSLPGAGPVIACELLALFGDHKDRFGNSNNAQCYFGTAPKNYQSGSYHRVSMRKACNKGGRSLLYDHAFASLRFSIWARDYYDGQRAKGKTHSVAIRALSNKWVRIIFKLWKEEIFYDESKKISSAA